VEALLGRDVEHAAQRAGRRGAAATGARRWSQAVAIALGGLLIASAAAALYSGMQAWREREIARQEAGESDQRAKVAERRRGGGGQRRERGGEVEVAVAAKEKTGVGMSEGVREGSGSGSGSDSEARRAEGMFVRANGERAAGRNQQALDGYTRLLRAYPETRSGRAARISRAELLLRRMDQPELALVSYQAYLAAQPDGALAEEARVGVATSLQRLGRQEQERTAWQALLEHHPGSLHAGRARARLLALSR